MSDTVKLIIEIPKAMYDSVQNGTYCGNLYKELKNGIPLDDVTAEINNIDSMTFIGNGSGCASEMRTECLKIIDKYIGKAESEDKE